MADLRRVVLDVLKPHEPSLLEFTERVATAESVDAATGWLVELDQEVQNVEIGVEGEALDYGAIEATIEDLGGSVHSVDEVAYGESVVEVDQAHRDD